MSSLWQCQHDQSLVQPNQSAFIKGQQLHDNFRLCNSVLLHAKKTGLVVAQDWHCMCFWFGCLAVPYRVTLVPRFLSTLIRLSRFSSIFDKRQDSLPHCFLGWWLEVLNAMIQQTEDNLLLSSPLTKQLNKSREMCWFMQMRFPCQVVQFPPIQVLGHHPPYLQTA